MALHNPNNWHWVSKPVSVDQAKEYLDKDISSISAEKDGVSAKIDEVSSLEGEAEVSQRKGKVITLFEFKLELKYSGKNKEGEAVSGTITVPEVDQDKTEHEYVFEIDIDSESSEKQPVKDLVRSTITPQLRKSLQKLAPTLIERHGPAIQHAPGSNPSSGFTTPKYVSTSHVSKGDSNGSKSTTSTSTGGSVNVTTVTDTAEFRTTAAQLYKTFTEADRLTAFTRAAPKVFEGAKVGGKFELFDGNISGEFVKLEDPTTIVQKWRQADWIPGHFSTLEIKFDQNDEDHVTNMRVQWTGVPVGKEDVVKTNWENYYVMSIKRTFGFGTVL